MDTAEEYEEVQENIGKVIIAKTAIIHSHHASSNGAENGSPYISQNANKKYKVKWNNSKIIEFFSSQTQSFI